MQKVNRHFSLQLRSIVDRGVSGLGFGVKVSNFGFKCKGLGLRLSGALLLMMTMVMMVRVMVMMKLHGSQLDSPVWRVWVSFLLGVRVLLRLCVPLFRRNFV